MYKEVPVQNRLVQRRFEQKETDRHLQSLQQAKPAVRCHWPERAHTAAGPSKKEALAFERNQEVERQNRNLLGKISSIMHSNYHSSVRDTTWQKPPRLASLNVGERKEALQRINHENQQLLNRLMRGKSHFSTKNWDKQHSTRRKILDQHGQYPYILDKKQSQMEQLEYAEMAWQTSTKIGDEDPNSFKDPLQQHLQLQTQLAKLRGDLDSVGSNVAGSVSTAQRYQAMRFGKFSSLSSTQTPRSAHSKPTIGSRMGTQNVGWRLPQTATGRMATIPQLQQLEPQQPMSGSDREGMSQSPSPPKQSQSKRTRVRELNTYSPYRSCETANFINSTIDPTLQNKQRQSPQRELFEKGGFASWKLFESRTVINRQASILDEKRIVLFKKGKQMGGQFYIVEISSNNAHIFITAFSVEKTQTLLLEIPERRSREVLDLFDGDFELMMSCLRVGNNQRLMLLNPNFQGVRLASRNMPGSIGSHGDFVSVQMSGVPHENTSQGLPDYAEMEKNNSEDDGMNIQTTLSEDGAMHTKFPQTTRRQTMDGSPRNTHAKCWRPLGNNQAPGGTGGQIKRKRINQRAQRGIQSFNQNYTGPIPSRNDATNIHPVYTSNRVKEQQQVNAQESFQEWVALEEPPSNRHKPEFCGGRIVPRQPKPIRKRSTMPKNLIMTRPNEATKSHTPEKIQEPIKPKPVVSQKKRPSQASPAQSRSPQPQKKSVQATKPKLPSPTKPMNMKPMKAPTVKTESPKVETIDIVVTRNRKTKERVQIQPLDSFGDVKPPGQKIHVAQAEARDAHVPELAKQAETIPQQEILPAPGLEESSSEGEVEIIYNEKQSRDRMMAAAQEGLEEALDGDVLSGQQQVESPPSEEINTQLLTQQVVQSQEIQMRQDVIQEEARDPSSSIPEESERRPYTDVASSPPSDLQHQAAAQVAAAAAVSQSKPTTNDEDYLIQGDAFEDYGEGADEEYTGDEKHQEELEDETDNILATEQVHVRKTDSLYALEEKKSTSIDKDPTPVPSSVVPTSSIIQQTESKEQEGSFIPEGSHLRQHSGEPEESYVEDNYEEDEEIAEATLGSRAQTKNFENDQPLIAEDGSPMLRGSDITYETEKNTVIPVSTHPEQTPRKVRASSEDEYPIAQNHHNDNSHPSIPDERRDTPIEVRKERSPSHNDYDYYQESVREVIAEEVRRDTESMRHSSKARTQSRSVLIIQQNEGGDEVEEEDVMEDEEYSEVEVEADMDPEEAAKYEPTLSEIMKSSPAPMSPAGATANKTAEKTEYEYGEYYEEDDEQQEEPEVPATETEMHFSSEGRPAAAAGHATEIKSEEEERKKTHEDVLERNSEQGIATPDQRRQPIQTGSEEYSQITDQNVVQASEYLDRDSNDRVYGNRPISDHQIVSDAYMSSTAGGQNEDFVQSQPAEEAKVASPDEENYSQDQKEMSKEEQVNESAYQSVAQSVPTDPSQYGNPMNQGSARRFVDNIVDKQIPPPSAKHLSRSENYSEVDESGHPARKSLTVTVTMTSPHPRY